MSFTSQGRAFIKEAKVFRLVKNPVDSLTRRVLSGAGTEITKNNTRVVEFLYKDPKAETFFKKRIY